ncbi:NAD(+) kinase [Fulvia fulva]|uniref:NAD(+) kinase n=1 Tax=Passalora fulva TaxID=5499 RepID=A0A9Q8LB13_PASFU|nr:NAD(+) kinase [Fulvia fulva]KAK4630838.1 NAD(+) kinase [Fulvia fulva]KAK4632927.1 NAD(+) kinase [Fulvia fulva]UJO14104.1 NAD(+) kinase [Fulvia fulva]WPV11639.1 NAD(+) kinase [Fulvia fulva]WPV25563.1 NAD(+) kinase [Fulvia fulva]
MPTSPGSNGVTGLFRSVKNKSTGSHNDDFDMAVDGEEHKPQAEANGVEANDFEQAFVRRGGDEHHRNSSDSEGISELLEVIFDKQDAQRRRASMVPETAGRPKHQRQATSCFVHSLLEEKTRAGDYFVKEDTLHEPGDKHTEHNPEQGNHTQSRLLTKKQLSDMAFGIRELSKKLGHIRLLLKVRNVFLLTKAHDKTLIGKTREISEWLLSQQNAEGKGYIVWVEETMKDNKTFDAQGLTSKDESYTDRLKYWNNEICAKKPHQFEICLALGGDGTVLYASWLFQRIVPPVMSFALGSLGFLTKFDFEKFEKTLPRAFNDGVTVSLRLRFEATIMRSTRRENGEDSDRDLVDELIGNGSDDATTHKPDGSNNILNDIVLDRGPTPTMTSIEVFGDDEHFTTVQADGICVATPTGSTAYNLAAGGSLCHPDNPVILVTAIAPHTLSFRPIILPDTIVLRIGVPYDARASCWASFDGKERSELRPGDYVTISASRFPFPSVLPLDRRSEDWVDSISRTLNWNNRQRQKAFDDKK